MEPHRGPIHGVSGWPKGRASSRGVTSLCRRHSLDSSHRGALETSAQTFPLSGHVLASIESVDRGRHLGKGMDATTAKARPARPSGPPGVFCRWNICVGEKRGEKVGKTKRGKGTKIMVLTDGHGLPLGIDTASASPHEVTLIEPLLEKRVLRRKPCRLIYDMAADSDPLRARLAKGGIELICPHRENRVKRATQDGRPLRRYRRHWKVERSISWLQNFRRLVTRYEYHAHLFHGFVQLACLVVVLKQF